MQYDDDGRVLAGLARKVSSLDYLASDVSWGPEDPNARSNPKGHIGYICAPSRRRLITKVSNDG